MNIDLAHNSPTDVVITVKLEESDYKHLVEAKLKEYGRRVQLKGFRPGKVPPALIKKMYGKAILFEEINQLTFRCLGDYITENNLSYVGEPLPITTETELELEMGKDFTFQFQLGVVPDFQLSLDDIQLTNYEIQLSEAQFEEEIDHIRRRYGNTEHPETSEEDDFLYGILHDKQHSHQEDSENTEEGEIHEHHHQHEHFHKNILLPLKQVSESEISKFIGIKADDVVNVDIQKLFQDGAKGIKLATGISEEEAEKLEGEFEFILTNITRSKKAELDEELYIKLFPNENIQTEDEFRAKLQEEVAENYRREVDYFKEQQIKDKLVVNTEIQIPTEFLKAWLIRVNKDKFTVDEIEAQFDDVIENLKWDLIRDKICRDNDIRVDKDDITAKARQMILAQFGGIQETPEIKNIVDQIVQRFLTEDDGKNYNKAVNNVLDEKALKFLSSSIVGATEVINRDDFESIAYNK
jgi:trigger factor